MTEVRLQRPLALGVEPAIEPRADHVDDHGAIRAAAIELPGDVPPEVEQVTRMLLASGSDDPFEALMGVLFQVRAMNASRSELDVKGAEQRRDVADLKHEEAIENAKKAAEKRLNRAPKWVRKLVSAIVTVVGAAAAAFTGGAALGLALAGAVLILAADGIGKLAAKLGASEKAVGWLKLGVQIAGAALTLGAGAAGGASAAATKAVEIAQKATKVVKLAMQTVETTVSMVDASRERAQWEAMVGAEEAGLHVEASEADVDKAIEMLGRELAKMRCEADGAAKIVGSRHQARQAVVNPRGGWS